MDTTFSQTWLWGLGALLALKVGMQTWLCALNRRQAQTQREQPVPEAFRDVMTQERYERSLDYTLAKNRFGSWELLFDGLVTAGVLFSGVLPWLAQGIAQLLHLGPMDGWKSALGYGGALVLVGAVLGLPSLPWEWWAQFRLEERFGFNKSTMKLWVMDKVKGLIVSLLLGVPIIAALLKVYLAFPTYWWVGAIGLIVGFQALMLVIYPLWIMPWFNRFEPLKEGSLRDRLMALAKRTEFTAQDIQVMDGSKRSGHSNAFFAGLGRWRRIVLFDTLVEQLSDEELEAVLAHEIGHYKCGHIPKRLFVSVGMVSLSLGALGWLLMPSNHGFFTLFGFPADGPMIYYAFLLLSMLSGILSFWLTPLFNMQSRKHEYEADAFAKQAMGAPEPLVSALRKLHDKNLSQLLPHPVFSGFYYSHPTLLERQAALQTGQASISGPKKGACASC